MQQYARNDTVTVAATPTLIAMPRRKRTTIYITNNGTTAVTIVKDNLPVVSGSGLIIAPNGGTWVETNETGFTCWQGLIHGIVAAGTAAVSISETWEE